MNNVLRKVRFVLRMVDWSIWLEGVFWMGVGIGVVALALD